jgi:ribosomal-protein-alanine N-acetyltransferase
MKHIGTKRIETERLILRRVTHEDAQAMYRNWASDPEVTRYLTWPTYEKVETA